jgi:Zn-dependent protease with chaperone function
MKSFLGVAVLLFFALPVSSQTKHTRAEIVENYCRAPEVTSGPEFERMASIHQRLAPILARVPGYQIHVAVVDSNIINAWENNLNSHVGLICVPTAFVRFMGTSEGEMAFFYAHEIGHALDDTCKSDSGRAQIARQTISGELDKLLGGFGRNALAEQRTCEARADDIGFRIFTAAGYDPYDAAGGFGRLQMLMGDTSTGVLGRLSALGNDHPITPDRIRHMRILLAERNQREGF